MFLKVSHNGDSRRPNVLDVPCATNKPCDMNVCSRALSLMSSVVVTVLGGTYKMCSTTSTGSAQSV